ncbi:MAG: hypothetical protein A2X59_05390 [Nitrospirae bacterium GWC2_42_7]|nr:MAG: hypothetical protein A2X59_05390 [Nitrospirae bacterium GWC2_42_7]
MDNILSIILTLSVLAIAVFLVPLLIEAKRTIISLRRTVEDRLNPALEEMQSSLKSIHNISDNVNDITEDIRRFSGSVSEVGQTIHSISGLAGNMSSSMSIKALSLRTGIIAGIKFLLTNLMNKGERK